ncbi:MAG: enoyl-[acyl-carrier-protein] reductase [Parachlamydiaceae bacterium]|nr:enoyl-[acyl-carrier-protein] reductase [Parachlamydiaceae bacterium]
MLNINLEGKIAFIAGIGDDQGFGWAIAKSLAEAGATIIIGTWTPILKIFSTSLNTGKFDASRRLCNGKLLEFAKIYPLDASFDTPDDVPEEIKENKRYKDVGGYTISEVADQINKDFGTIDIFVHSLANAPEVKNPLLKTSRKGYLAALSSSSYSFISLLNHLGPHMNKDGAAITLSYIASERIIPGYGGGMSSAKAALESDTRTLAWEAGREWGIRVNTISAGPLPSRAATAIGFIQQMINYSQTNAPLPKNLLASEIGYVAAFLVSPLASAITGSIIYVDNGLHAMGVAPDSPSLQGESESCQ